MDEIIDTNLTVPEPAPDKQLFTPFLKKAELVLIILSVGSIALKLLHVSFAGTLLIITLSSLALLYMVSGVYHGGGRILFFRNQNPEVPFVRRMALNVSGNAMALICLGVIFKFQFWEGGKTMMMIGGISAAVALVIIFILFRTTKLLLYRQLLNRIAIFLAIGLMLLLLPQAKLLDIIHPENDSEKVSFKRYLEHPEDPEVRKAWNKMQDKMDSIRNSQ